MNIPNSLDIYEGERGLRAAPGRYELFQDYPFNQGESWLGGVNFADGEKNLFRPLLVGFEVNLSESGGGWTLVGAYEENLKHMRRDVSIASSRLWRNALARPNDNWGAYNTGPPTDDIYTLQTVWPALLFPGFSSALMTQNDARSWRISINARGLRESPSPLEGGLLITIEATASGYTGEVGFSSGGTPDPEGTVKFYVRYPGHPNVEEWVCTSWTQV